MMRKEYKQKYRPYPKIELKNRKWPERAITKAPAWCSVDLRDGNQALICPMTLKEKLLFYKKLIKIGFKEIEVGFPSAAKVEFDFLRKLIDENLVPKNVKLQVLVQAREHLIAKTFESLKGTQGNILHLYNSTSTGQRKIVFRKDKREILDIAVQGVIWVKEYAKKTNTDVILEYSPESFTGTELEYALEVCNAVIHEWQPNENRKIIINLPATVELSTPNIYADMIEWMSDRLVCRENVILSVHTHNDRGTAVAATELALMAGADRVEGTLFGNGERTGNADIVAIAINLYVQGVDPKLNFKNIDEIVEFVEKCNKIPIHPRHPYAGSLVYTAFSGSHQDAINKGMRFQKQKEDKLWEVPYLPIDPTDLGRTYEGIIRINSQSGKGGAAYILEKETGYSLPKAMLPEFGKVIQSIADDTGKELDSGIVLDTFNKIYLESENPIKFRSFEVVSYREKHKISGKLVIDFDGKRKEITGIGNGPLDACKNALLSIKKLRDFKISSYYEHALSKGSTSKAIAYVEIQSIEDKDKFFGVGIDTNITQAAVKAVISAVNRTY